MSILEFGANEIVKRIKAQHEEKETTLYCFILDSFSEVSCIAEPSNGHKLTFSTIEYRIRLRQNQEPDYASDCGIPGLDDPQREAKLRNILREMRVKNLLRSHLGDRWSAA